MAEKKYSDWMGISENIIVLPRESKGDCAKSGERPSSNAGPEHRSRPTDSNQPERREG